MPSIVLGIKDREIGNLLKINAGYKENLMKEKGYVDSRTLFITSEVRHGC